MRVRPNPVEALAALVRVMELAERRACFRQAVAALGQSAAPGPVGAPLLDGIDQDVIARAVQVALDAGLVDDLDWLAPGPAAAALYEITAALPPGKVRLELGRRVFSRMYEGTASTFATVATRMALTSSKPFEAATLRARVSLLYDLPLGATVSTDPLALTLVTRPDLRARWIEEARTGALPARRLAAKLLEHAAREATLRAQQGDPHARQLFNEEPIRRSCLALLADREPLVWRHVAVARGLLAAVEPQLRQEIELSLDPALSPTEWRRAAVSLVALCVSDPDDALRACRQLLDGPIAELDKGLPATLVLGLPRVVEAEPALAETLLAWIAETPRPDVAEAVAALLGDVYDPSFGAVAAEKLRAPLMSHAETNTSVLRTIAERALRQLDRQQDEDDVAGLVRQALTAYESSGARAAFVLATRAINALDRALEFVTVHDPNDEQVVPYVLGTLKDIDGAALERPTLNDLLLLGRRPGDAETMAPEMEKFFARLGGWLLTAEASAGIEDTTTLAIAAQRRLRALLHLMDVDIAARDDEGRVRRRISQAINLLIERVTDERRGRVQRIACATLARALDAAVREGMCEPADLLLVLAERIEDPEAYATIAEASTNPDVRAVVSAYTEFLRPVSEDGADAHAALRDPVRTAERVVQLSHGLGSGGSYRGEALRRCVLAAGRALDVVAQARGQAELVEGVAEGQDVLGDLERALDDLHRLEQGAARRVLGSDVADAEVTSAITDAPEVSALLERAARSAVPATADQLAVAIRETVVDLPPAIASAVTTVLRRLETLPIASPSAAIAIPLERRRPHLPDWLLPQRTMGAFYVVRALGSGGASSVFVARRLEERNNHNAEGFALKVPDYDPTTARSLSEEEFFRLFRDEAGALLALPEHPNLARFVTFDLGARPKPILVMELITGTSLDRLIRSRSLSVERTLAYLSGILEGLEAMHGVGVGHLDLKPSNVILREDATPVLVDFGLSGRHLRPGCGSIDYCAPEVLGVHPPDIELSPLPADVYSFACAAFEALTSLPLFDGDEMEIVNQHVGHDGWPERLAALAAAPGVARLAELLAACLRHDPRHRPSAARARAGLATIDPTLGGATWPLVVELERQAAVG